MNLTVLNQTILTPGATAYLPWELYVFLLAITFLFFIMSITSNRSTKFTAIISPIMFLMMAYLTWAIEFHGVEVILDCQMTEIYLIPYSYVVQPPYIAVLLVGFFFASVLNAWYVWFRQIKEIADTTPGNLRRY